MMKEAITERLKFLTELLRFAFVVLLAIGGGTLGLLLGPQDPLRLGFAIAGIVASLSLAWYSDMDFGKTDAAAPCSIRGTSTMIYDIITIIGAVIVLGTIVGVLWAASRM